MDWSEKCTELGVNSVVFRFDYPRALFESEDLIRSRKKINDTISKNGNLSILGDIGIGKTYILMDFLRRYNKSEVGIIRPRILGSSYRIFDFFDAVVLSINKNSSLKWKLSDRKSHAISYLQKSEYEKFVVVIDNSQSLKKDFIKELFDFKKDANVPLSILFFGSGINSRKDIESFRLNGLSDSDKRKYFKILNEEVSRALPYSIPIEIVNGCRTYFDIREKYVDYAWKVKKGIIKF